MVEADLTREDLLNLIPRPIWLVAAAAVVVVAAAVVAVVEYSLGSATWVNCLIVDSNWILFDWDLVL